MATTRPCSRHRQRRRQPPALLPLLLLIALAAAPPALAAAAKSPASFDCRRAVVWAEKTVCADAALAAQDRRLAEIYGQAAAGLPVAERQDMKKAQRAWIRTRNACVRDAQPIACLGHRYEARIAELAEPAAPNPLAAERIVAHYGCDDGRTLEAAFDNREPRRVLLTAGAATFELPQALSASGARYSDGSRVFWSKGSEALFETAEGQTTCHARP